MNVDSSLSSDRVEFFLLKLADSLQKLWVQRMELLNYEEMQKLVQIFGNDWTRLLNAWKTMEWPIATTPKAIRLQLERKESTRNTKVSSDLQQAWTGITTTLKALNVENDQDLQQIFTNLHFRKPTISRQNKLEPMNDREENRRVKNGERIRRLGQLSHSTTNHLLLVWMAYFVPRKTTASLKTSVMASSSPWEKMSQSSMAPKDYKSSVNFGTPTVATFDLGEQKSVLNHSAWLKLVTSVRPDSNIEEKTWENVVLFLQTNLSISGEAKWNGALASVMVGIQQKMSNLMLALKDWKDYVMQLSDPEYDQLLKMMRMEWQHWARAKTAPTANFQPLSFLRETQTKSILDNATKLAIDSWVNGRIPSTENLPKEWKAVRQPKMNILEKAGMWSECGVSTPDEQKKLLESVIELSLDAQFPVELRSILRLLPTAFGVAWQAWIGHLSRMTVEQKTELDTNLWEEIGLVQNRVAATTTGADPRLQRSNFIKAMVRTLTANEPIRAADLHAIFTLTEEHNIPDEKEMNRLMYQIIRMGLNGSTSVCALFTQCAQLQKEQTGRTPNGASSEEKVRSDASVLKQPSRKRPIEPTENTASQQNKPPKRGVVDMMSLPGAREDISN